MTGSVAATAVESLIYNEGVKFIVGPLSITEANHVVVFTFDWSVSICSPESPYTFQTLCTFNEWLDAFWKMVGEHYPEVKNVVTVNRQTSGAEENERVSKAALEANGIVQLATERFEAGTVDFYPLLTKILRYNPDAIDTCASGAGNQALMVKQARELGFTGRIIQPAQCPTPIMLQVAGAEAAEGVLSNDANYTSTVFSKETRELYQEYLAKYTPEGGMMNYVTTLGYGSLEVLVAGIEAADSIDVDAVKAAIEAPDFRCTFFGENVRFGGKETYGVNHIMGAFITLSEIRNGELVTVAKEEAWAP